MRKELCFRMETEEGIGMYGATIGDGNPNDWFVPRFGSILNEADANSGGTMHPSPDEDGALGWHDIRYIERSKYYFGFASIEQLRRWLFRPDLIAKLPEYNLAVSIYETEDYHIGDTQMVFRKSTANRVGRFQLTT